MEFSEKLLKKSDKAFDDWLDWFVKEIKPVLETSAEEGYKAHRVRLNNREDKHFFQNDQFLDKLESKLLGCTAVLNHAKRKAILTSFEYTETELIISWSEK